MKQYIVHINVDNAAFCDEAAGEEVARILTRLAGLEREAANVNELRGASALYDINGNKVGVAGLLTDEEED